MMKKYILICFCLGLVVSPTLAQHQDSIAKAREEADALDVAMRRRSEADSAYRVRFNALRYSMQKRHRPKGEKFVNENFFDNTFIGVWGGYNRIVPRSGVDLHGGAELGLSVTKFFKPSVGVRLSGSWTSSDRKSDNEPWNSYSVTADHLFNLSSSVLGYNPHRKLEALTVSGLGYHLSSLAGKRKSAADFHVGMLLKLNTGTRLDIFAEPRLTFYTDGIDLSDQQNWHKYDIGLSAMIGLSYRLGTYYKLGTTEPNDESFMDNTFISAGMGMQFQNSELTRQQGLLGSMGPIYHISVGKWFLDSFGFRLSAFSSMNSWRRDELGIMDLQTGYTGGRVELMLNPFAFFRKDVRDMRWGIIPMIGVEKGIMKKQDAKEKISKNYTGWTGGLQLKYYASDNFAFYVEPRMSRVPYSFAEKTISGQINNHSFYDNLFNASIGIELRRPTRADWRQQAALRDGFVPYFFTQFGAGIAAPLHTNRGASRRLGFMLTAAAGRQFTPISGVRLGLDVNNASTYDAKGMIDRYAFTSLSLDYMFDISNLVIGYNPEREFGVEIFAGPVLTKNFDQKRTYIGVEGGTRAYWNILDQFDIYAEPRMRLYKNRYMPATKGAGTPLQYSLTMGTSYRFGSSYKNSLSTDFGDGTFWGSTFVSASVGSQMITRPRPGINPLTSAGPVFSVAVGKWLLPFWGIRATAFGGYSTWGRVNLQNNISADRLTSQFGARIEAMLNVLAIGKQEWRESRWGLTPMLGVEFGKLKQQNASDMVVSMVRNYTGVTAAIQAKYYVTDNIGVFVEPRLSRIPYSVSSGNEGNQRVNTANNVMSINFGFELRRGAKTELKRLSTFRDEFEPYFFVSAHVGGIMPMHRMRYTSRRLGFLAGATVGRQFLPASGVRASLDISSLPGDGQMIDTKSFVNLSLDYLFDISNYMGGYDPERKLGVEILAGPVLSLGSVPNKTAIGAEGGFRAYYKVHKAFDVYLEPKVRLYSKSIVYGSSLTPLQMMLSVGTSYKF